MASFCAKFPHQRLVWYISVNKKEMSYICGFEASFQIVIGGTYADPTSTKRSYQRASPGEASVLGKKIAYGQVSNDQRPY